MTSEVIPDPCRVPLLGGGEALIDVADLPLILPFRWRIMRGGSTPYAVAAAGQGRKGRTLLSMHRVILGAVPGQVVDHVNHDGLDNRRANIRLASHAQNMRRVRREGEVGFRGVVRHRAGYQAQISVDNRTIYLGKFADAERAARAYDAAALRLGGSFAVLNFPDNPPCVEDMASLPASIGGRS